MGANRFADLRARGAHVNPRTVGGDRVRGESGEQVARGVRRHDVGGERRPTEGNRGHGERRRFQCVASSVVHCQRAPITALHLISTRAAGRGRADTATVARAGCSTGKYWT